MSSPDHLLHPGGPGPASGPEAAQSHLSSTPTNQVHPNPPQSSTSTAASFFKRYSNWAHSSSSSANQQQPQQPQAVHIEAPNPDSSQVPQTSTHVLPELQIISESNDDQKTLIGSEDDEGKMKDGESSDASRSSAGINLTQIKTGRKGKDSILNKRNKSKVPHQVQRPCQTHSFHTEAVEVQHMEKGLIKLLDDFNSGKLKAFGHGLSMEQMGHIRNQQENLARLHFELGSRQDSLTPLSEEGLAASNESMDKLMERLEKLSLAIGQLSSAGIQESNLLDPKSTITEDQR